MSIAKRAECPNRTPCLSPGSIHDPDRSLLWIDASSDQMGRSAVGTPGPSLFEAVEVANRKTVKPIYLLGRGRRVFVAGCRLRNCQARAITPSSMGCVSRRVKVFC